MRSFLIICATGLLLAASVQARAGSLDIWTSRAFGTTNTLNAVTYSYPYFVAVGNGGVILTSTNGADWTIQNSGTTNNFYGVACGNGTFVAVGLGPVYTSTNLTNWTSHSTSFNTIYGVAWGNGLFVCGSSGGEFGTSTNGTHWTLGFSPTNATLRDMSYANGLFFATGNPTIMLVSSNDPSWTSVNPGSNEYGLWGVAYGNKMFVAVGGYSPVASGGFKATSPDGYAWTGPHSFADQNALNYYSVAFGNGTFVTVGGVYYPKVTGTNRLIETSADAASWTTRLSDTNGALYSVTYGNGSFVAVGQNGGIVQSAPIFSLAVKPQISSKSVELDLTGEIGRAYHIQTSTNPLGTSWTDLAIVTNTSETSVFLDTQASNRPAAFYRAVSP